MEISFNGFNVKTEMRTMQVNYLTEIHQPFFLYMFLVNSSHLWASMPAPQQRFSKDVAADSMACCDPTRKRNTVQKAISHNIPSFRCSVTIIKSFLEEYVIA